MGRTGISPVAGVSVTDAEAIAHGDAVGVLVYSPTGILRLQRTSGVQVLYDNPGEWIPIIGRLAAVNAALATLGYEPRSPGTQQRIRITACDFGGSLKQPVGTSEKQVTVRVS